MSLKTRVATTGAVLGAVALASGCGGSSGTTGGTGAQAKQTAAAFIRDVTTEFSRGQTGRLWDSLHPADQAVVSRARYAACASNVGFELKKIKIVDTYSDSVDLAGTSTPATAVSVQTTSEDGVTTATVHAVSVNGKWRWILSPSDYAAYKKGTCPKS